MDKRMEMDMMKIVIKAAGVSMEAELLQTPTADAIYNALPVMGSANVSVASFRY